MAVTSVLLVPICHAGCLGAETEIAPCALPRSYTGPPFHSLLLHFNHLIFFFGGSSHVAQTSLELII